MGPAEPIRCFGTDRVRVGALIRVESSFAASARPMASPHLAAPLLARVPSSTLLPRKIEAARERACPVSLVSQHGQQSSLRVRGSAAARNQAIAFAGESANPCQFLLVLLLCGGDLHGRSHFGFMTNSASDQRLQNDQRQNCCNSTEQGCEDRKS